MSYGTVPQKQSKLKHKPSLHWLIGSLQVWLSLYRIKSSKFSTILGKCWHCETAFKANCNSFAFRDMICFVYPFGFHLGQVFFFIARTGKMSGIGLDSKYKY